LPTKKPLNGGPFESASIYTMSLTKLELQIASDFTKRLRELVGIYAGGLSDAARRYQNLLEMAGDDMCVDIFQKLRPFFADNAEEIMNQDIPKLQQAAQKAVADTAEGGVLLSEALGLWEKAAKRDRIKTFSIVAEMLHDVDEWHDLGGGR